MVSDEAIETKFRNSRLAAGVDSSMSLVSEKHTGRRRIAIWALGCLAAGILSVICVAWAESFRDDQNGYEVYSAYLSSGIQEDAHDWSVDAPIEVVIQNRSAIGSTMRFW